MARKFIGRKEIAFISRVTKELVQGVIGQEVTYYAVLADKTKINDLYNEAVQKTYAPAVIVNALVHYENTTETVTQFPADAKFKVDVRFHKAELDDRNLMPKMGDFVQFGPVVYEVYSVVEPQPVFGQIENMVMVKCNCGPARQGQFSLPKQPNPTTTRDLNAPKYSEQPPVPAVKLKGERK